LRKGRFSQSTVVGDEHPELGTNRQGRSEVDCIQRAQLRGPDIGGAVEQRLVEADEVDRPEQATGFPNEVIVPGASQGAHRLGAQQRG
jgi:hypothetical protein